jgi:hypothetical protein
MDEMRRLDMLMHLRLLREHPKNPSNLLDQFRGLEHTDEEFARLLADPERSVARDSTLNHGHHEQQELTTALSQLEDDIQRPTPKHTWRR